MTRHRKYLLLMLKQYVADDDDRAALAAAAADGAAGQFIIKINADGDVYRIRFVGMDHPGPDCGCEECDHPWY